MKVLNIVSLDRCLKVRGTVNTCFKCRLYMTVCLGNSKDIALSYSEQIKKDRVENQKLNVT